jgi:hypothetical protein
MDDMVEVLALIKQALDIWEVDPDEASIEEQQVWEDLNEVGIKLARLTGEPEPE